MKSLIIIAAIFISQYALTQEKDMCLTQATNELENLFYDHLDKNPGNQSPEGLSSVRKLSTTANNNTLYSAHGSYLTYIKMADFHYKYSVSIELEMNNSCLPLTHSLKETIDNIGSSEDESNQVSCSQEIAILCEEGYIDRCLKYAEAKTHQCVPDIKN